MYLIVALTNSDEEETDFVEGCDLSGVEDMLQCGVYDQSANNHSEFIMVI
jgi:hypothetical protein